MDDANDVRFEGRVHRPAGLRIGIVLGAALLFVVGAVATMGASPAPSSGTDQNGSSGAGGTPADPGFGPGRGGMRGMMGDDGWQLGDLMGKLGGRGPMGQISITAIDGSKVSLKTEDGWTRTVTVTDSTTITKGGQTVKVSDLKVGDTIRLGQTRNADGTWTVNRIAVVVPTVAGTVKSVTSSGFTIEARNGLTQTIRTSGSTLYKLGTGTGSSSDVKVGTTVLVAGTQGSDGSITALTVEISVPRIAGEVTAISGNTITIQRGDGLTTKVNVDSSTTYEVMGVTSPTLKDITVGMRILVEGPQNDDGSIHATAIHAGLGLRMGKGPRGWGQQPATSPAPSGATTSAG